MTDRAFAPTFHASAEDGPFGSPLCGFTPEENEGAWVTQIRSDVNCHVCLDELIKDN